jgi:hypothetical protein
MTEDEFMGAMYRDGVRDLNVDGLRNQIDQEGGNPGVEATPSGPDGPDQAQSADASPPGPPHGASEDPGLQNPESLPAAEYNVILAYACASCGEHVGLADPRAVVAAMQRMSITMRCPKCKTAQRLDPPKAPEQSRIIRPGMPMNRHERRALAAAGGLCGIAGKR